MARKKGYPWDKYMEFLQANGKSLITASTYASQCRRLLKTFGIESDKVEDHKKLTEEDIEEFIRTQNKKSQTPYRSAWRSYNKFIMESEGVKLASGDICRGWEDVPDQVASCIKLLNAESGLPLRTVPNLKWNINNDPKLAAKFPDSFLIKNDDGSNVLLPKFILEGLKEWGYPETPPTKDDPLIPRSPHNPSPMPLLMMRKIAGIITTK